jgi:hypothetical protein
MKYLLATCAILGAVVFGWPLVKEDTRDECVAAESHAEGPWRFLADKAFLEMMGRDTAEKEWPGVPPQIGCALVYWMGAPSVQRQKQEAERQRQERAALQQPTAPTLQQPQDRAGLQREQEEAVERVRQQECKDLVRIGKFRDQETCLNTVGSRSWSPHRLRRRRQNLVRRRRASNPAIAAK